MDHTRRRLLALTSSLTLPLVAGCTGLTESSDTGGGSSGGSDGGSSDGGGGSDNGDDGGGDDGTEEPTETATATPVPTDPLLERTRVVMDEIRWFGTEYERARRNFVLQVKPVMETIETLRQRNTLTEGDVEELRSRTTRLATFVEEKLAPHFEVEPRLVNGNNFLVRDFESAVGADDSRATGEALDRLAVFYNRVTTDTYIEQNLSASPIEDPLHSHLHASDGGDAIFGISYPPGDNFTTQTFSDDFSERDSDEVRPHAHTFETGQRVVAHAHKYDTPHDIRDHQNEPPGGRLYAFSGGAVDILKDSKAWREELHDFQPEYTNVFEAVVAREGRVDQAYVMVNDYVTGTDKEGQFVGRPIFVQRYEDETRAAAAMETLMQTRLAEDGTTTLADREWTKVTYDYDGPNLYGNVLHIGEFVIATGVSPTPHRRRGADGQWPEQLKKSWLAIPPNDAESEGE